MHSFEGNGGVGTGGVIMENSRKKRKRRRRRINRNLELAIKFALFFICIGVGSYFAWGYFSKEEVNLAELTKVSLIGYDSEGRIEAKMDGSSVVSEVPEIQQVLDTVELDFSKEEHLSNGEQVEIVYTYDKKLAESLDIRIQADVSVLTIDNLPQAEVITIEELFADVELVYEGTAPMLQVSLQNNSEHPYIKTMDFVIREPKEYYAKGDVILVEACFSEEDAIAYRYDIEKGENGYCQSYCLDHVDSYLTEAAQLTEEAKNKLIEEGQKCFTDANEYGLRIFSEAGCMPIWENKKTTFTWKNPYVISMYFDSATEEAMGETGVMINDVKIVYGVTLTQANGVSCDAEIVVRFDGLIQKADGTLDLALDTGSMISASHKDKFIKDIVRNTYSEDQYKSERIL